MSPQHATQNPQTESTVLPFPDRTHTDTVNTSSSPLTALRPAFRVAFHVPTTDNNGDRFSDGAFLALEAQLVAVAGGWYRSPDVDGEWRAPNRTVWREECRRYVVTVDENLFRRVASAIEAYVKEAFDQEATYLEVAPVLTSVF
jgi:hypothetical protein